MGCMTWQIQCFYRNQILMGCWICKSVKPNYLQSGILSILACIWDIFDICHYFAEINLPLFKSLVSRSGMMYQIFHSFQSSFRHQINQDFPTPWQNQINVIIHFSIVSHFFCWGTFLLPEPTHGMQGHFYNLFKVFKCLLYNNDCFKSSVH